MTTCRHSSSVRCPSAADDDGRRAGSSRAARADLPARRRSRAMAGPAPALPVRALPRAAQRRRRHRRDERAPAVRRRALADVVAIAHAGASAGADRSPPSIRFTHIEGVTKGMEVEWTFQALAGGTHVRIVHVWEGRGWPTAGESGGDAGDRAGVRARDRESRTLAGLATHAERRVWMTAGGT